MMPIDVIHTLDIWHGACDGAAHVGSIAHHPRRQRPDGRASWPLRRPQRGRDRPLQLPRALHPRPRVRVGGGPLMAAALRASALVPDGHRVPASRPKRASTRFRELIADRPFVFAPGVYDPMTAELAMYHRFDAIYFSGYSFAVGYLGTTDMDLYSSVEIADGARRTVQALPKFQLTMAVGDPGAGIPPTHLEIPPVVVDMDAGYGNVFNVQRTAELYVNAGVAGAHIEDQ